MNESKPNAENQQNGRRFDPELLKKGLHCDLDQYEMLKRCSDKGAEGIKEWNEWRKGQPQVFLEGISLSRYATPEEIASNNDICKPFSDVDLILHRSYLKNVNLRDSYLSKSSLIRSDLESADMTYAQLENVDLTGGVLKSTIFERANLKGANLSDAQLESANFQGAIFDGETLIWKCKVDRDTNFEGSAINSVRIDPANKQLLEYNIRRKNWEEWYKEHPKLKWLVKSFWWVSDYGISTGRIIATFFALAFFFAIIYYLFGRIVPPGILDYLFVDGNGVKITSWLVPIRALHFSVVVMTVGFTNMHANAHSAWAHILVSMQMILGFVLLGALVTRFAVLFTAGGPAGKFADEK